MAQICLESSRQSNMVPVATIDDFLRATTLNGYNDVRVGDLFGVPQVLPGQQSVFWITRLLPGNRAEAVHSRRPASDRDSNIRFWPRSIKEVSMKQKRRDGLLFLGNFPGSFPDRSDFLLPHHPDSRQLLSASKAIELLRNKMHDLRASGRTLTVEAGDVLAWSNDLSSMLYVVSKKGTRFSPALLYPSLMASQDDGSWLDLQTKLNVNMLLRRRGLVSAGHIRPRKLHDVVLPPTGEMIEQRKEARVNRDNILGNLTMPKPPEFAAMIFDTRPTIARAVKGNRQRAEVRTISMTPKPAFAKPNTPSTDL